MDTFHKIASEKVKCLKLLEKYKADNYSKFFCPPNFDGRYCWPATRLMVSVTKQCPKSGLESENISRVAAENNNIADSWPLYLTTINIAGHSLSGLSVLLAIVLFLVFKQVKNTRLKMHFNLFIVILLQALVNLTINYLYGYKLLDSQISDNNVQNDENAMLCRILIAGAHYLKCSLFTWLLIEAWHFYSIISLSPYKQFTITSYVLVGWGLPFLIIKLWMILHLGYEGDYCWVNVNDGVNVCMEIINTIIILASLFLYILNVRTIYIKMNDTVPSQRGISYWNWLKASLTLVPLFGSYNLLYSVTRWIEVSKYKIILLVIVRIICSFKKFFTSACYVYQLLFMQRSNIIKIITYKKFEGCLIAILYCFTTNEIQQSVKRAWNNWRSKQEIYTITSRN